MPTKKRKIIKLIEEQKNLETIQKYVKEHPNCIKGIAVLISAIYEEREIAHSKYQLFTIYSCLA